MDRILFFMKSKGKQRASEYKVRIFRNLQEPFAVYYFRLCGYPSYEEYDLVKAEMQKAYFRLQERYVKKEEGLRTYLVYEENFEMWLEDAGKSEDWKSYWQYPLYRDYSDPANLQWILKRIPKEKCPSKACVLGCGLGIRDWLPVVAGRVNRIEFYLEFATKGIEELQEMLLEEYGMLTEVHLISGREFSKLRIRSEEPVLVIDCAGKESISLTGLKRGSIWVDMESAEVKQHAIEESRAGVQYWSLKSIWKREMLQPLDIVDKFAYNTDVKIGKL